MSLRALQAAIEPLPYALSEQVLSYAKAIEAAAPDIFADAGVQRTREQTDKLIFIAGMRKLYAIAESNFWVMDNAGAILAKQNGQAEVRIGGADFSSGGRYHKNLKRLLKEFTEVLGEQNLLTLVRRTSYADVVREIANER